MRSRLALAAVLLLGLAPLAPAQTRADFPGGGTRSSFEHPADPATAPVYYTVERSVRLHAEPHPASVAAAELPLRTGVRVLAQDGAWSLVDHENRRGYVPTAALSNVWIRIDKSERTLYVYRGDVLAYALPADVSTSDEDKVRRSGLGEQDHYRIPEGTFYVTRKNPDSQYYRAFVISYPNSEHAARGLRQGLITQAQYDAIVRAEQTFTSPPMGTRLGGLIEIHGQGSGRRRAWTRGCVALRNVHMDDLWDLVHVGTPVVIER